ncbi:MAG: TfoX/Sxy family protein [Gammaproteobacteria bacterium]|nr:TfoX/Sxy family protein [Gammaproteobacteria bacterium]
MSEFINNLADVFVKFGPIRAKRMFGGYGVYRDDVMFGLVADDELYLKADQQSAGDFIAEDLPAFEYDKKGKTYKMSYYLAPEAIYDDPEVAREWAELAFEAALRARKQR